MRQIISGQLAFTDIKDLAHTRVSQIENPQSDPRSTDSPHDFQRRDSSWLVVAKQLSPRAVLARRRIPDTRTAGSVISPRRYSWIGRVEEIVFGRALMPDDCRQDARQVAREESSTVIATLYVSAVDVSIRSIANQFGVPFGQHLDRATTAKDPVACIQPLADASRRERVS